MNKRLKYEKINNSDFAISIDLNNGYSVIAISGYNPNSSTYITSLLLKNNTVDEWKLCEKAEMLEFHTTAKMLNSAILKQVADFLDRGFFDYYVERYEQEMAWRDKGLDASLNEVG